MTKVKREYIARRRGTKIHVFVSTFQGAHSRLTRTIAQQKIRALVLTHQDRDRKRRDFRRLLITRINGLIREREVYYNYNTIINNYSKLIHILHKRQLLFNSKILAQLDRFDEYPLIFIFNECEIVKKRRLERIPEILKIKFLEIYSLGGYSLIKYEKEINKN